MLPSISPNKEYLDFYVLYKRRNYKRHFNFTSKGIDTETFNIIFYIRYKHILNFASIILFSFLVIVFHYQTSYFLSTQNSYWKIMKMLWDHEKKNWNKMLKQIDQAQNFGHIRRQNLNLIIKHHYIFNVLMQNVPDAFFFTFCI